MTLLIVLSIPTLIALVIGIGMGTIEIIKGE